MRNSFDQKHNNFVPIAMNSVSKKSTTILIHKYRVYYNAYNLQNKMYSNVWLWQSTVKHSPRLHNRVEILVQSVVATHLCYAARSPIVAEWTHTESKWIRVHINIKYLFEAWLIAYTRLQLKLAPYCTSCLITTTFPFSIAVWRGAHPQFYKTNHVLQLTSSYSIL